LETKYIDIVVVIYLSIEIVYLYLFAVRFERSMLLYKTTLSEFDNMSDSTL